MGGWLFIILLYLIGSVILIVELFLPAYGLLGVVGVGVLIYALYETFMLNQAAGLVGLVSLAIVLPAGLVFAVKNWHRSFIGRRISPPNRKLTEEDRMPVNELEPLVGRLGRSLTPLRPVGTCVFDGRRVECKAEYGMIERDVPVEGVRLVDRTLSVRPVDASEGEAGQA